MTISVFRKPTAGAGGYNTVEEEGTPLTQRTIINFTGSGVTASDVGGETQVNIPGGGGASMSVTEQDFGALPGVTYKEFAITDAAVSSTSHIPVWLLTEAPTGRDADEAEMEPMDVFAKNMATGSFTLVAEVRSGPVEGLYKFGYMVLS
jgi:hypothetical protein